MLTFQEDRRRVELHKDKTGAVIHKASFDMSEPMPWRVEVDLIMCADCFECSEARRDLPPEEDRAIDAAINEVEAKLVKSNHAWACDRIAEGAPRLTEVELLARSNGCSPRRSSRR